MEGRDSDFEDVGGSWEAAGDSLESQYDVGVTADETDPGFDIDDDFDDGALDKGTPTQVAVPAYRQPDIQGGEPDAYVDSKSTVYADLAKDMLDQSGHPSASSPAFVTALAEYMESGVIDMLNTPPGEHAVEDGGNPAMRFLDRTEAALGDGTLLTRLNEDASRIRADEIASMGLIARRRALKADAQAAQERYDARQVELRQIQPETVDRQSMPLAGLRPEDQITLNLKTHPAEKNVASCTLRGVVHGPGVVDDGQYTRNGVSVTIQADERTNPDMFDFEALPPGTKVVLTGTALSSNNYVKNPGRIVAGQSPVVYWGGRRVAISSLAANGTGHRNMELDQLAVNDVAMFGEPNQRPPRY
jgi:hypothetical protein